MDATKEIDWEQEPKVRFAGHTWSISVPTPDREKFAHGYVWVEVEDSGLLNLHTFYGFGEDTFDTRKYIYDWLIDWELATWRKIGPEDHELFATKKLDPDFGIE